MILPLEPIRGLPLFVLALSHFFTALATLVLLPIARLGIAIMLWSLFRAALAAH
jgi:hypothetical protein